ncbi:MAG TPA: sulfatase-like hydrolase/transferase [Verrucomicrobiae bacterium]|nr:sulfatase-like hydrolase/transferase [Verrucomicrobiae bacterium]
MARLSISAIAFIAALSLSFTARGAPVPTRPNVIFILADDQGSVDANCYGAKDLVTPGVDRLAAQGVRFTQFYSAAPVCSPSRAGLLTGRYPWLAGMPNNGAAPPTEAADQLDTLTGQGLPASEKTLADMFRAAGYATAHIGKWHLGLGAGHRPLDHGFDYSFGFMGGCIDNWTHFFYWAGPNRHDLWENNQRVRLPGHYFPDLMVERAEAFISTNRDRPFFMYFAMNMPHYPYQGDPKWIEHYHDLKFPRNLYAAFVSTLDERVQRLMKFLEDSGLRERTLIVYQSDNGHSVEERAHYGGGSSGPYRGAKFSLFEGGIRLPAIISWPGHLPEGQVRGQVAHACDWMPTLAQICGVALPKTQLNGRSLVPAIESAEAPSPNDVLQWRLNDQWAVREGPWKLLHNPNDQADKQKLAPRDKKWFLANIEDDPGERTNLAALHPDIVTRLQALEPAR